MVSAGLVTTTVWGGYNAFTSGQAIFNNFSPVHEKQIANLMNLYGLDAKSADALVYPYLNSPLNVKIQGFVFETFVQLAALFCIGAVLDRLTPKNLPRYVAVPLAFAKCALQIFLAALIMEQFRNYVYIPHVIPYLVGT